MDILHATQANHSVLVNNDSDFTPLVIRLEESNVTVLRSSSKSARGSLVKACDEFLYFEDVIPVPIILTRNAVVINASTRWMHDEYRFERKSFVDCGMMHMCYINCRRFIMAIAVQLIRV